MASLRSWQGERAAGETVGERKEEGRAGTGYFLELILTPNCRKNRPGAVFGFVLLATYFILCLDFAVVLLMCLVKQICFLVVFNFVNMLVVLVVFLFMCCSREWMDSFKLLFGFVLLFRKTLSFVLETLVLCEKKMVLVLCCFSLQNALFEFVPALSEVIFSFFVYCFFFFFSPTAN